MASLREIECVIKGNTDVVKDTYEGGCHPYMLVLYPPIRACTLPSMLMHVHASNQHTSQSIS